MTINTMNVDEIINLENSMLVRYYFLDEELYSTVKKGISKEQYTNTKDKYLADKILRKVGHNDVFDEIVYKFFSYIPALSYKETSVDRILCLDNLAICYVYLNEARCLYRVNELYEIINNWKTSDLDNPEYREKCNLELADKTREILREKRLQISNCETIEEIYELYGDDEIISDMIERYRRAGLTELDAKKETLERLKRAMNYEITCLSTTIKKVISLCPIEYSEKTKKMFDPIKLGMLLAFKSMQNSVENDADESTKSYEEDFNFSGVYAYWFYKYIKENQDIYGKYKDEKISITDMKFGEYSEYSLSDFMTIFEKFYQENMSEKRILDRQEDSRGISFSEFDERFKERAERDKEKIKLEVAAKDWEIIRAGTIDEERNNMLKIINDINSQRRKRRKTEKDKLEAERKYSERINALMQKWEFFDKSNYIITIKGINEMRGYIGYIYPNGTVIFEQFFEERKDKKPAYNKAIYVMDILNFIEKSTLNKQEIMDYIKNSKDESIKRIYHSKNWKTKAEEIIKEESLTEEKSKALKIFLDMLKDKKDEQVPRIKMTKVELEKFGEEMKLKGTKSGIVIEKIKEENQKNIIKN